MLRLARGTRNVLTGDGEKVRAMMSAELVLLCALPLRDGWPAPAHGRVREDGEFAAVRGTVRRAAAHG